MRQQVSTQYVGIVDRRQITDRRANVTILSQPLTFSGNSPNEIESSGTVFPGTQRALDATPGRLNAFATTPINEQRHCRNLAAHQMLAESFIHLHSWISMQQTFTIPFLKAHSRRLPVHRLGTYDKYLCLTVSTAEGIDKMSHQVQISKARMPILTLP